jgi:putative ABC transport system substrate-binding protein
MTKQRVGALIVLGGPPFTSTPAQRTKLAELAAKTKLPTCSPNIPFVRAGGLLSYAPAGAPRWPLAATYVDKILRGAKPGDLPVQQPTEFELAVNLKAAKALGLTIPPSLLLSANHIVE